MSFQVYYSSISEILKKRMLARGFIAAIPGALLLFYMGLFAEIESLMRWGATSFIASIALISYGLIPYKRITRLEMNPYKLVCLKDSFELYLNGKLLRKIPKAEIVKLDSVEKFLFYGIKITLNNDIITLPFFKPRIISDL